MCKVTDFGLSRGNMGAGGDDMAASRMTGLAGTFHWMAPEVLEKGEYSFKSDMWSYGVILWELQSLAKVPFKGTKMMQRLSKDLKIGLVNIGTKLKVTSNDLQQLQQRALQVNQK